MSQFCETASFRGDDAPCLVEASLACRVCLSGQVEWGLRVEDWDAEVRCHCLDCGDSRSINLTDEQALRLSLHPVTTKGAPPAP